jgi:hypothetical protein
MRGIGLSPFKAEKTLQTTNVIQHHAHEQDGGPNSRKRLSDALQLFGRVPIALGCKTGVVVFYAAGEKIISRSFHLLDQQCAF